MAAKKAAKKLEQVGPWKIGQAYLVRGVTNYCTGRLVAVHAWGTPSATLEFTDAAWIASTGRFSDALKKGICEEVEPVDGPYLVNVGAIMDAQEWNFDLPRGQK